MEKYLRGNGKWAKVSGKSGCYYVAMGYEGETKAVKTLTMAKKVFAMTYAENWLEY